MIEFNHNCPDGSHPDGTCVTADPQDMSSPGKVQMPGDAWNAIQAAEQSIPRKEAA